MNWFGGHFSGNVFDRFPCDQFVTAERQHASNTDCDVARRHYGGSDFPRCHSSGVAGAVITVLGAAKRGSDREIETY